MIFNRLSELKFLEMLKNYPVVSVTGPRQSGKTTLVQRLCPDYKYVNLEDPAVREIAASDPHRFLKQHPGGLILDEIQRLPILLSYLQVIIDKEKKKGMYVLTGSHQPEIQAALTQSLAGRTAILQLLPLSLTELKNAKFDLTSNELLLNGFYPRIYNEKLNPTDVYRYYVQTYLERDVRQMIHLKDLLVFQRFMKLCAARTGTILNMHSMSNDLGVSNHTIKHWLSILKASYLIEFVPAYFENIGKQVIKSPKIYFTDVGLACYLLDIETISQVDRDPLRGQLFETLVAVDVMKTRFNKGRDAHLYFYRDSQKNEVDLIYKAGAQLIPIEIKSSQTFSQDFLKGLNYFKELLGDRCGQSYLVYSGDHEIPLKNVRIINYKNAFKIIDECDEILE